ncbi:MAG: protease modulator HflK, partial [Candidatus Marinimicrobia bacterium]|nr:protease modulator HflK [Candidatus Neomarinimicrobiota bacterium]
FGRGEINQEVQKVMQQILDSYGIGVQIVLVNLQDVDPPPSVKPAFDEVNAATQDMDRLIQEARREFNESVPRAKGEAEKKIRQAEAYAIERVNLSEGEADRFISVYNEYRKARRVTRRRMYLETLADVLPKIENKWILEGNDSGILKLLDLNIKEGEK